MHAGVIRRATPRELADQHWRRARAGSGQVAAGPPGIRQMVRVCVCVCACASWRLSVTSAARTRARTQL